MNTYVGPCKIECPMACNVPTGATLTEAPASRHNWGDVIYCPNGTVEEYGIECERVFLVKTSRSPK